MDKYFILSMSCTFFFNVLYFPGVWNFTPEALDRDDDGVPRGSLD